MNKKNTLETLVWPPQKVIKLILYLFIQKLFFLYKLFVGLSYSFLFILVHTANTVFLTGGKIDNQPTCYQCEKSVHIHIVLDATNLRNYSEQTKIIANILPTEFYFVFLLRNIDNASTIDRQEQNLRGHRPDELLQFGGVCRQGTRSADDQPCRG